jgi:hypothetical protein
VGWEAVAKTRQCRWSWLQGAAKCSARVGFARQAPSDSESVSNGGLDGRLETRK